MDGWTYQVGSVGNDQKIRKFWKKILTFFAEKFRENMLSYFQEFSAKIFAFWSKNGWFYKILDKLNKKNLPKCKSAHKTFVVVVCLFVCLFVFLVTLKGLSFSSKWGGGGEKAGGGIT